MYLKVAQNGFWHSILKTMLLIEAWLDEFQLCFIRKHINHTSWNKYDNSNTSHNFCPLFQGSVLFLGHIEKAFQNNFAFINSTETCVAPLNHNLAYSATCRVSSWKKSCKTYAQPRALARSTYVHANYIDLLYIDTILIAVACMCMMSRTLRVKSGNHQHEFLQQIFFSLVSLAPVCKPSSWSCSSSWRSAWGRRGRGRGQGQGTRWWKSPQHRGRAEHGPPQCITSKKSSSSISDSE